MESGKYKRWTNADYFPHSALRSSAGRFSHFPQKGREIEQTNRSSRERDEFYQAVPSATVSNVCHLQFSDFLLVSNYYYWNILIHFSCLLGKNVHLLQCNYLKVLNTYNICDTPSIENSFKNPKHSVSATIQSNPNPCNHSHTDRT